MAALIGKRRWVFLAGLVVLIALIWGVSLASEPVISIKAGVDSQNDVQLADDGSYSVTFKVEGAQYLAFVQDGTVFDTAQASGSGRYVYHGDADSVVQAVTVYATSIRAGFSAPVEELDTRASVKYTVPHWQGNTAQEESEEEPEEQESEEVASQQEETQEELEKAESQSASAGETNPQAANTYRTDITFDQLARDPDKYKFEYLTLVGMILQVTEGEESNVLRVAVNGDYDDVVIITYDAGIMNGKRILEDDKITFSGQSLGTFTYETVFGASLTVPLVKADIIIDSGEAPDDYGYSL